MMGTSLSFCHCGDHAFRRVGPKAVVLVSVEDADILAAPGWYANYRSKKSSRKYVSIEMRLEGGGSIGLARVILKAGRGVVVDHASLDSLDNRRSNIRICSYAQNAQNRRHKVRDLPPGVQRSTFKGYEVLVRADGKRHWIGRFPTVELAYAAYQDAAKRLHGEFARVI